jgi:hypothetical protein
VGWVEGRLEASLDDRPDGDASSVWWGAGGPSTLKKGARHRRRVNWHDDGGPILQGCSDQADVRGAAYVCARVCMWEGRVMMRR